MFGSPFWFSATFGTCETIVAGNLPSSRLHWRAFGGNGYSSHLREFQQSPFGLTKPHIPETTTSLELYKNYGKQKPANVPLVATYGTAQ